MKRFNSASRDAESTISSIHEANKGKRLTNQEIINKAAEEKKRGSKQQIQKPPPSSIKQKENKDMNKETIKEATKETNNNSLEFSQLQSQILTLESENKQADKFFQLKLKEKSRELQVSQEKVKLLENENTKLKEDIKNLEMQQYLVSNKIKSDQVSYCEKRQIILMSTIFKQQDMIKRYCRIIKQTRSIQNELEHQIQLFQQECTKDNTCEKILTRLRYAVSQEQNINSSDITKKGSPKDFQDLLTRLDCSLYKLIPQIDKSEVLNEIQNISLLLLSYVNTKPFESTQKIALDKICEEFIDLKLNKIYPFVNPIRQQIINQIQNDKFYRKLGQIDTEQLQYYQMPLNNPMCLMDRQVNILRSMVIHCLAIIHSYNMKPQFKSLKETLVPFLTESNELTKYKEDYLGSQILWNMWKEKRPLIDDAIESINKEMNEAKIQYKGIWDIL